MKSGSKLWFKIYPVLGRNKRFVNYYYITEQAGVIFEIALGNTRTTCAEGDLKCDYFYNSN
jgi:hypothetical protein